MEAIIDFFEGSALVAVTNIIYLCVLIILLITSISVIVSRSRKPPESPLSQTFTLSTSRKESTIWLILGASFSALLILLIFMGQITITHAVKPEGSVLSQFIAGLDPADTILMLAPVVLLILAIRGGSKKLIVDGDHLERLLMFGIRKTYYFHDIARIERMTVRSSVAPTAITRYYQFRDMQGKVMFSFPDTTDNLAKFWDVLDMYGQVQSFFDHATASEMGLFSDRREDNLRATLSLEDMPTAGISFTISNPRWIFFVFIVCAAVFAVISIVALVMIQGNPAKPWIVGIFLFFTLLPVLGIIAVKRWKVEVRDDTLYVFSSFGSAKRPKVVPVASITDSRLASSGSIKLYAGNKKVLAIDPQVVGLRLFIVYLRDRGVSLPIKANPGVGEL